MGTNKIYNYKSKEVLRFFKEMGLLNVYSSYINKSNTTIKDRTDEVLNNDLMINDSIYGFMRDNNMSIPKLFLDTFVDIAFEMFTGITYANEILNGELKLRKRFYHVELLHKVHKASPQFRSIGVTLEEMRKRLIEVNNYNSKIDV